ncbi:hypothetical protein B7486_28350 [cyanobacterium TDX16]|nr:hypothetical protein B7486_28350 [cyanobacterium TDX16]
MVLPMKRGEIYSYPFEVKLEPEDSGLPKSSKIQAQQIRTISKRCFDGQCIGCLSEEVMALVDNAIKLHLQL